MGGPGPQRGGLGKRDLPLEARDVELEEPAVLDDLPGDVVRAPGELLQADLLSGADAPDDREVVGGQDAEVLAVLVVDALDALGDHHLNAGVELGVGAGLAAAPLAPALARHRADEAAVLHGVAGHRVVGGAGPPVRRAKP